MATSIMDPFSCSFAKGISYELFTSNLGIVRMAGEPQPKFISRVVSQRFNKYCETFGNEINFTVTHKQFVDKLSKIQGRIELWGKAHFKYKQDFLSKFNSKTWAMLSPDVKSKHSLFNCQHCMEDQELKSIYMTYPLKSIVEKKRAEEKGWVKKVCKEKTVQHPEQIPKSKSPKNKTREIKRKMKQEIEIQKMKTCVERTFGNHLSLSQRKKMRLQESFETISECKIRTQKNIEEINEGLLKKHKNVCHIKWNLDDCIKEVSSHPEGSFINFSALGRKYNITNDEGKYNRNGGQIVKEALIRAGVDVDKFEYHGKSNSPRSRRQLIQLKIETTMPKEPTEDEVIKELKKKIVLGIYTMGEEIVPQIFKKLSVKDGSSFITEIEVTGRKQSLCYLREEMLKKHQKYFRQFSDTEYDRMTEVKVISELERINEYQGNKNASFFEQRQSLKSFQRTRNIALWHDTSTIAGHSYLLMMVKCLYDPAIFYTDKEYDDIFHKKVRVQVEVEKPLIYIIGRCPPTDDQLKYSYTRLDDLHNLKHNLSTEKGELKDVMRFFHGDGPASSFEIGHQKGGNYFCWDCGIYKDQSMSICQTFYSQSMDIASRMNLLSACERSQKMVKDGKLKVFENIKKGHLIDELHQRGVKFFSTQKKDVLLQKLENEVKGIQNAPALLIPNIDNGHLLESYEILANEPMHDIAGHWKNLIEEIPYHLDASEKILFNNLCSVSLAKDAKRAVDYRKTFINICLQLKGHIPQKIYDIFLTGCEMQEILYASDNERDSRKILRYCLKAYQHSILLSEVVNLKPRKVTCRKLYGKYYHALVRHAGKQLRIVSGKSAHAEQEERQFNYLKTITKLTTNNHPSNIMFNLWIRYQAKCILGEKCYTFETEENTCIRKFNRLLPAKTNTTIDLTHIESHPREWQAFLETMIPDYLVEKGVWWEEKNGCDVERYLSEMWKNCEKSYIPAKSIIEGENDEINNKLQTLKYFKLSVDQKNIT